MDNEYVHEAVNELRKEKKAKRRMRTPKNTQEVYSEHLKGKYLSGSLLRPWKT